MTNEQALERISALVGNLTKEGTLEALDLLCSQLGSDDLAEWLTHKCDVEGC